jgi:hypothetical protein
LALALISSAASTGMIPKILLCQDCANCIKKGSSKDSLDNLPSRRFNDFENFGDADFERLRFLGEFFRRCLIGPVRKFKN